MLAGFIELGCKVPALASLESTRADCKLVDY